MCLWIMSDAAERKWTAVIAAGGTGGHIFPGLATADALVAMRSDAEIIMVGAGKPMEQRIMRTKPYRYEIVAAPRLERSAHPKNFLIPFRLVVAVCKAGRLLRGVGARVVIGTGGYASAPVVIAGRLCGIPTVLLEQNIIPGLTNRVLSRWADLVCVAFDASRGWLAPRAKVVMTGNPIREVAARDDIRGARRRLNLSEDLFTVFVFGGSLGARRLVAATQEALPLLRPGMQLIVQTGSEAKLLVPPGWTGKLVVRDFFDEIYDCYRAADLVVCRAGGVVAEVLAFGRPMILVPYPYAAHGHQKQNAVYLEQEGAAVVVDDDQCDGRAISRLINDLYADAERREAMARASRELGRPDAARRVAAATINLVEGEA